MHLYHHLHLLFLPLCKSFLPLCTCLESFVILFPIFGEIMHLFVVILGFSSGLLFLFVVHLDLFIDPF